MGPDRSYGALSRKHGIEPTEMMRHARGFLWGPRINALKIQQNEETSLPVAAEDDGGVGQVNRQHLSMLKHLQAKAFNHLRDVAFDKPETALRMLIDSMKLERDIKGMSKDREDDLKSVMMARLKEMEKENGKKPDAPPEPEFPYEPDYEPPALNNGPENDSAPPSGGDHAE